MLTRLFFKFDKKFLKKFFRNYFSKRNVKKLNRKCEYKFTVYYSKNFNDELAKLCDFYGTDKGEIKPHGHPYDPIPSHSYTDYYSSLFFYCRNDVKKVFECGIGTTNPNIPSAVEPNVTPGSSLRVWRDYFPNANIYGADIDKTILFTEERIKTFYINQLDPATIYDCWAQINETDFDLIVDDGLHTFEAGSTLFAHSIQRLSKTGIYIIEDVHADNLLCYKNYFDKTKYKVEYITLHRPNRALGDNSLVVIRK